MHLVNFLVADRCGTKWFQHAQVFLRDLSTRFDCKLYCSMFTHRWNTSYFIHPRTYTHWELL